MRMHHTPKTARQACQGTSDLCVSERQLAAYSDLSKRRRDHLPRRRHRRTSLLLPSAPDPGMNSKTECDTAPAILVVLEP